jgi:hypothetical protein
MLTRPGSPVLAGSGGGEQEGGEGFLGAGGLPVEEGVVGEVEVAAEGVGAVVVDAGPVAVGGAPVVDAGDGLAVDPAGCVGLDPGAP